MKKRKIRTAVIAALALIMFAMTTGVVLADSTPTGVYLNPSSGNDRNNGLTRTTPVKTLNKAIDIWEKNNSVEVIYMLTALWTNGDMEIKSPIPGKPLPIYRASTGSMLVVQSGKLTLEDVIMDGCKDTLGQPARHMVFVYPKATLEIKGDKTELRNNSSTIKTNDVTYDSDYRGGAVHCQGNLIMSGGKIHDNEAGMGGGVYVGRKSSRDPNPTFDMSGGEIYNNRTINVSTSGRVKNDYYAGGGVMLGAYTTMTLHGDAQIRNNRSLSWGGGISLGNLSYNTTSISYNNCELKMYSDDGSNKVPKITGNSAKRGGGIFVQGMNKAEITAGDIMNNTAGELSGFPAGGGIYVNGDHRGNIASGELTLRNVEMTANRASGAGGAIMGCASSATYLRDVNGAVIHDNTAGFLGEDVTYSLADQWQSPNTRWTDSTLSEFILGGGYYHWKDMFSFKEIPQDKLFNIYEEVNASPNARAEDIQKGVGLAKVRINSNTVTAGGGGAIGNNGVVFIGEYRERIDIELSKEWLDDVPADRPSEIRLVLKRDGEECDSKIVKKDNSGQWPAVTFAGLPKNRLDSKGSESTEVHVYTIEEDYNHTAADGTKLSTNYEASVKKSSQSGVRYIRTEDDGAQKVPGASYDSTARVWKIPVAVEKWTLSNAYKQAPATNKYTITYKLNGGEYNGSVEDIKEEYDAGTKISIHAKPTRDGYTFLYWEGSRYDPGQEYTVNSDHTFTAQWKKNEEDLGGDNRTVTEAPQDEGKNEETKKDGGSRSSATGDETQMMILIAVMIVSLAAIIGLMAVQCRRSRRS